MPTLLALVVAEVLGPPCQVMREAFPTQNEGAPRIDRVVTRVSLLLVDDVVEVDRRLAFDHDRPYREMEHVHVGHDLRLQYIINRSLELRGI